MGLAAVRAVLNRLSSESLVEFKPNRGAFVASPSFQEALDVFDTRTILEREIAFRLGSSISKDHLRDLDRHLKLQRRTHRHEGGAPTMNLAEEFHVMIARMAGNAVLETVLGRLIARTSLALALYGRHNAGECGIDEHAALVEAFRDKAPEKAATLMRDHLDHVFRRAVSIGQVRDSRALAEALAAHLPNRRGTRPGRSRGDPFRFSSALTLLVEPSRPSMTTPFPARGASSTVVSARISGDQSH